MLRLPGVGLPYKDLFLAVAITSLVFVAVAVISIAGVFGALLVPIPILYFYSKMGRLPGVAIFALSLAVTLTVLTVLHFHASFLYFSLLGLLGVILSETLRKNRSIEMTIIYSGGTFLFLGLVVLLYLSLTSGEMPWSLIGVHVSQVVQENINLYSQAGVPKEQLNFIQENVDQITRAIVGLFPSIALVGTVFLVWVNILEGKWLFRMKRMWYPSFGDLSCWSVFDRAVWLLVIAGVLIMAPMVALRILGLNIMIVLLFLYMLQGLAIMSFFFRKKNIPVFLRVFGYFLVFAQQFLLLLVAGLGLVDTWVDFRKLDKKPG
jgi:uncharacterized protein YybS (DUF2232 family)